jgi:hypothetical protein
MKETEDQVKGSNMVCADRGYLTPKLVEYLLMKCGFEITGTHKRMSSYPFTFGDTNIMATSTNNQHTIKKVGAKGLYVPKKKFVTYTYAVAYKGRKGRVATLLTTYPRYNTWFYRRKRGLYYHALDILLLLKQLIQIQR